MVRRRRLPGYGDTGVISSRVTSKKLAQDMERCLEVLANKALFDSSWYGLLDAVCRQHTVTLPKLLKAHNSGNLAALKRSLTDPLLTDAVTSFKASQTYDRPVRFGLDMLLHYAQTGLRLGDLDARRITSLCIQAEKDGRKRNTVRRSMLRGISLVLKFHLGNAERNRIFADVQFSGVDDTREIHLSPQEIGRLLNACKEFEYTEMELLIRLALQTSADRGVLLAGKNADKELRGLLVRDLTIYKDEQSSQYLGEIFLSDKKTTSRSRTVPLTDSLCRALVAQCLHKSPDDTVFAMRYHQMGIQWKKVRNRASLDHVRFKDLRAQTAIYGEEAGIPQTVLQKTMGHANEAMTRRYQQRAAVLSATQAEAIESAMISEVND